LIGEINIREQIDDCVDFLANQTQVEQGQRHGKVLEAAQHILHLVLRLPPCRPEGGVSNPASAAWGCRRWL
jgi:hypothetical protein